MSAPPPESASATYEARRERFAAEEARLAERSRALSWGRLAAFLGGVAGAVVTVARAADPGIAAPAVTAAAFAVFALLAALHARVLARQRRHGGMRRLNDDALARLARDWSRLPVPAAPPGATTDPTARDLDLFGPASLFQLLGTAHTPPGKTALAGWLRAPAAPAVIGRRQEAVAELAPLLDHRQELERRARRLAELPPDPEPFLAWCEAEPWLSARPALLWGARLLATASVGLLALWIAGVVPLGVWGTVALTNLLLGGFAGRWMQPLFDRVDVGSGDLTAYARLLELLAEPAPASPLRVELTAAVRAGGEPAHRSLDRLARRVVLSDARHSGLLHAALQALLLWDFHTLSLIERWQLSAGRHARGWLRALGQAEALAALAGLAFDHPGWAFPEVDATAPPLFTARALGHPLLAPAARVDNDVILGPPGTLLFVTGSNMSGKSTLLRAIGVNAVLAQAGAPVCAAALTMPPLIVGTSILVEDSLAGGVSFFLAELERLKAIVDLAAAAPAEEPPEGGATAAPEAPRRLLFLLDEVLRGTNARERRIAVERVLRHLLAAGALGAVSTHDLALAEAPGLVAAAHPVHFRETLHPGGDPPMSFDYRLRPGIAPTTNALRLLEMVGLGEGG